MAFPKPKLSEFELTTAVPSAVPWEGDGVLHGCNQTTEFLEQKERLTLHAELSVKNEKSGQHGLNELNYCLETRPTALSSIHIRTFSLCTREEICNSKDV